MRSSKSRSRNKNRNNRPQGGNIVNRVFDSSGPEGKVRGTPAQIIEKYSQLARDAQLSGDRVAVENFQQHSEHYTRMLAAAQKEIDARQQQNQQNNQGQQNNQNQQGQSGNPQGGGQGNGQQGSGNHQQAASGNDGGENRGQQRNGNRRRDRDDRTRDDRPRDDARAFENRDGGGRASDEKVANATPEAEVIEAPKGESSLVETPEAKADAPAPDAPKPKRTRTRKKAPAPEAQATSPAGES